MSDHEEGSCTACDNTKDEEELSPSEDKAEECQAGEGGLDADAKKKKKKRNKKKKAEKDASAEPSNAAAVSPDSASAEKAAKVPSTPPRHGAEPAVSPSKSCGKTRKRTKVDTPEVLLQKLTTKIAELEKQKEQQDMEEKEIETLYGNDTSGLKDKILKQMRTRKNMEKEVAELQQKVESALKLKERAETDLKKAKANQQIMENLVADLQNKNKLLVEEERRRIQEEQSKRVDMSSKFQQVLGDITVRMNSAQNEGEKGIMENEHLRDRLRLLREQMIMKDEAHKQEIRKCEIEIQHYSTHMERRNELSKQYTENTEALTSKGAEASVEGEKLKAEVLACSNRFMEYQNALQLSNGEFTNFKNEMQNHAKKTKILDHEIGILKKKFLKAETSFNEAQAEENQSIARLKTLEGLIAKVESMTEALQQELNQAAPVK